MFFRKQEMEEQREVRINRHFSNRRGQTVSVLLEEMPRKDSLYVL